MVAIRVLFVYIPTGADAEKVDTSAGKLGVPPSSSKLKASLPLLLLRIRHQETARGFEGMVPPDDVEFLPTIRGGGVGPSARLCAVNNDVLVINPLALSSKGSSREDREEEREP